MREWRKTHPLTGESLRKAHVRNTANIAVKRGRLNRQPCSVCGVIPAEKHHPDYSKPLEVVWLCRPHHMDEEAKRRKAA